jgi:hypothetical protein
MGLCNSTRNKALFTASSQGIPEESKVAITVVISCDIDEKFLNFKVLLIEISLCNTVAHLIYPKFCDSMQN